MNRLLFAAARGARVQTRYAYRDTFVRHGEWKTVSGMVFDPVNAPHPHEQRIHPDDEHLQYGPISTALRELAECAPYVINGYSPEYWYVLDYKINSDSPYFKQDELHRALFLLILAEALADSGL